MENYYENTKLRYLDLC